MIYKIKEIKPRIYVVICKNHFDLSMLFWRYQEFYESSNPNFKNKNFTLVQFMKWYSTKHGEGKYSYVDDYEGFNIPSSIIAKVQRKNIKDKNYYDGVMDKIYKELSSKNKKPFYLLGITGKNLRALDHEISHGLFFTNPDYKREALEVVNLLPKNTYKGFCKILKKFNYSTAVHDDEIIAYCSTGLIDEMEDLKISKDLLKRFKKTFKKYL